MTTSRAVMIHPFVPQAVTQHPGQQQLDQLPPPTLQNLVATANLNCTRLDLRKIAMGCRNAEYNPSRFPAVVMRIREPKTTALIFSKGKMVITGAKSE